MTATSKIEKILEKYDMFCFNTNISGINYAKAHQNVPEAQKNEDKKNEQNNMVKLLFGI